MNLILMMLFIIMSLPSLTSPLPEEFNPFNISSGSLEDSFRDCEMDTETIDIINITDSQGQVFDIDVTMVLETEVLDVVDLTDFAVWYEVFPSETYLTGIGVIVYEEDIVTNRDSFMLFLNETEEEQQWWFALFSENIFAAPTGELESWILEDANFCGLFQIRLAEPAADS